MISPRGGVAEPARGGEFPQEKAATGRGAQLAGQSDHPAAGRGAVGRGLRPPAGAKMRDPSAARPVVSSEASAVEFTQPTSLPPAVEAKGGGGAFGAPLVAHVLVSLGESGPPPGEMPQSAGAGAARGGTHRPARRSLPGTEAS